MAELEQLGVQYHRPHPMLRPWVSHYWELTGHLGLSGQSCVQTLFPGNNCGLIFQLGDPVDVMANDGTWSPRPAAFAEGHFHSPFKLRFSGQFRLAAIEFKAGQIYHFLRASQGLINDEFVDLRDVYSSKDARNSDMITPDLSFKEIVCAFDKLLIKRVPDTDTANHALSRAVHQSLQTLGRGRVKEMAHAACLSPRQLERQFKDAMGMSPKYFNCVVRFNSFVQICQAQPATPLTRLAHECGYYDQAHLIHEFKRFTGETPSKYLESGHEIEGAMTYLQREAGL